MIYDLFAKFFMDVMVEHNILLPTQLANSISIGLKLPLNQDGELNIILQKKPSKMMGRTEKQVVVDNAPTQQTLTERVKESWQVDFLAYNYKVNNDYVNKAQNFATQIGSILQSQITKNLIKEFYPQIIGIDKLFTIQDISSVEMTQNVKRYSMEVNILIEYSKTFNIDAYQDIIIENIVN